MFNFETFAADVGRQTVLCVGDLMLDEFVYGDVKRVSPEAPAPVIAVQRSEMNVGGAGNVGRNIAALGAHCIFVGVVGADSAGELLKAEFSREARIDARLIVDSSRPTTRKVRFVSDHFSTHLLRADWEVSEPVSAAIEEQVIAAAVAALPDADIVLLSDYSKGALTTRIIRNVIDQAKKLGKRIVVDPKSTNFAIYRGATVLTPNRKEFLEATRSRADTEADFEDASGELMRTVDSEAILLTRGEDGMSLLPRSGEAIHMPAFPVKVRDVSGAGDSTIAMVALALAAGCDWETTLRMANAAGAVSVGKRGTATVDLAELRRTVLPRASLAAEEKIAGNANDLEEHLALWRKQGQRIGFTNGCFDILHPGHVKIITDARAACDRLIVGLNSDASVKRLKGPTRPLQNERGRAEVLAALEAVDLVVVFEEDTPLDLIAQVRPNVLVKGGDYTREQVVGRDIVEADGGEVLLVGIVPGFSTSSLVKRAQEGGE